LGFPWQLYVPALDLQSGDYPSLEYYLFAISSLSHSIAIRPKDMRFQNQTAVITGASTGIGRAVAQQLAAEGARIVLVARTESRLEETRHQIAIAQALTSQFAGGEAVICPTDLRDLNQIETLREFVESRFGAPDIIVNAAGAWHDHETLFKGPHFDQIPAQEIDLLVDVELRATLHVSRVFVPSMKIRGSGKIINLSCGQKGGICFHRSTGCRTPTQSYSGQCGRTLVCEVRSGRTVFSQ
jgi:hypothetical protein